MIWESLCLKMLRIEWRISIFRETDNIRERLRQNHHHSSLWAVGSGLIPGATDRFLPNDCPPVCCLYLAFVAPDSRYRDAVLSQPRGRRSPLPLPSPGHVLIFSFKPVRRVHLDFATIRWKFCASLFSSGCATATLTAVAAKDNVRYRKTRINRIILRK